MDPHSLNVVSHESILVKSVTPLTFSIIWARPCSQLCDIYASDFGLTQKQKPREIELFFSAPTSSLGHASSSRTVTPHREPSLSENPS